VQSLQATSTMLAKRDEEEFKQGTEVSRGMSAPSTAY
jgi:hypothetical protein